MVVAAALPLLSSCVDRGNAAVSAQSAAASDTEAPSRETYAIGTATMPDGAIPQRATGDSFLRGPEIFVSVDVSGASTQHDLEVRWIDGEGTVLARVVRRAPRGTGHVAFSSGPTTRWRSGAHRAVIVIGGRTVTEKLFQLL